MKTQPRSALLSLLLAATPLLLPAQTPEAPAWAEPGSATHVQVPPPAGFHRPARNLAAPMGLFEGQSDIGGALVPGGAAYDAGTGTYTITSAGYNIWYTRDEFRFLWRRLSGDVSIAADVSFPNAKGYGDRKAVLVIRQDLDDDSREAMAAQHGAGLIHLAFRPDKGANISEAYRIQAGPPAGAFPRRIGIEKRGDSFALYISLAGEPMHQAGPPVVLHVEGPFYAGIGFCSHLPVTSDAAALTNVVLENTAGRVR